MGHVIEETLNPEWDTKTEFFTLDYTQVSIMELEIFMFKETSGLCWPFKSSSKKHCSFGFLMRI